MFFQSDRPVQRTAVGCGLVAWDVVLSPESHVVYSGVGGTVGNVLSILSFLGWHSVPIVRLGADNAGLRVLQDLVSAGVDTSAICLDKSLRTPIVYQTREPLRGHHTFSFRCPRCGLSRRYSPASLQGVDRAGEPLRRGDVFFYDRVTPEVVSLAERARLNGATTVFEPSALDHDQDLVSRALRAARVVKYSSDRLEPASLEALDAGFVEIQTLGAKGLRFRMRSLDPSWVDLAALPGVSVVDAAGAGDWCTAGFLYALDSLAIEAAPSDLGYNRIHAALKAGQFLAAMNCATIGARGLMRSISPIELLTHLNTFVDGGDGGSWQSVNLVERMGVAQTDPAPRQSVHLPHAGQGPALCECAVGFGTCLAGGGGPTTAGGSLH